MHNEHAGVKTFVGKTIKGVDGSAEDFSSKVHPRDLKEDLPLYHVVHGVVIKDHDIPLPKVQYSNSSSTYSYMHATLREDPAPDITNTEQQGNPSLEPETRVLRA